MAVRLETARLILRDFVPEDAPRLFDLDHDDEVMRYLGPYRLETIDAYREMIETKFAAYARRGDGLGFWAVIEKSSGEFLGWVCLRPAVDYRFQAEAQFPADAVELGYRLRAAFWRRGYATEASQALIADLHARRPDGVVVSSTLETNRASVRVMEKCGLRFVGRFQLPGFDVPAVKYELDPQAAS